MPSNPLSEPEADALRRQVAERLRWAARVVERLKARGYGPDDLLYRTAEEARAHLQDLHVAAHYESIPPGQAGK